MYHSRIRRTPWNWEYLSANPSITMKFIESHLDKHWEWGHFFDYERSLSNNLSITTQFIEQHSDKDWNWGYWGLSTNPCITPEFVESNLDKPWIWGRYGLSSNPRITTYFIECNLDKNWYWGLGGLSSNKFTFQIQKEQKEKEEKAARTIQRHCHNWLWAPKCRDGTTGLMVLKMLRDLSNV